MRGRWLQIQTAIPGAHVGREDRRYLTLLFCTGTAVLLTESSKVQHAALNQSRLGHVANRVHDRRTHASRVAHTSVLFAVALMPQQACNTGWKAYTSASRADWADRYCIACSS